MQASSGCQCTYLERDIWQKASARKPVHSFVQSSDSSSAEITLKKECMDPDFEEHYKELLKQWVVDEFSIKERLDEMAEHFGKSLDELKEAIVNPIRKAGDKGIVC